MYDLRVITSIIFVIKARVARARCAGGIWAAQNLVQSFSQMEPMCVFNQIFSELAGDKAQPDGLMIDATHLKAHRTACFLLKNAGSLLRACLKRLASNNLMENGASDGT